jgi:hypothetical protein
MKVITKTFKIFTASLALMVLSLPNTYAVDCIRHFYNNTNITQYVTIGVVSTGSLTLYNQDDSEYCSVQYTNSPNSCSMDLSPGSFAIVEYTYFLDPVFQGAVTDGTFSFSTITDPNFVPSDSNPVPYSTYAYSNQDLAHGTGPYECPYISHDGDTGIVLLNQPANGDVTWSMN